MSHQAELLLHLHGAAALAVVFLLPALECSAFVGILFPGEIAVLLGGVLAFQHRVSLPAVLAAAIAGAIVGDSVGYFVGRRWGRRMLDSTIGRWLHPRHIDRAEDHLRNRGGLAVLLGRFTAALRVLVPGLAGMANMPYGTFALYNVVGGVVWATTFVLVGYAAGSSWREAESVASRASVLVLLAAIVIGSVLVAGRWASRNPDAVRRLLRGVRSLDAVRWCGRALRENLAVPAIGCAFAVLALLGWLVGLLVRDVVGTGLVDRPVLDLVVRHRVAWLDTANRAATWVGDARVAWPTVLAFGVLARVRRGRWHGLAVLTVGTAGGMALVEIVKTLVDRTRPPATLALVATHSTSFPSGHTTNATIVWLAAAALYAAQVPAWRRKVAAWTVAVLVALAVGASRVYLGAHWVTDVAAAWALGGLWVAATVLVLRAD